MRTYNATVVDFENKNGGTRIINLNEGAIEWLFENFKVISIEEE